MSGKRIAAEVMMNLKRRIDALPARSAERRNIMHDTAELYGVSQSTLYRQLREFYLPKSLKRSDHGIPRALPVDEMEHYCEIIAALKIRTNNKKGRHISTVRAIEVLEDVGIETPDGLIKPEKGLLNKATVNRHLKKWGFDHRRLTRETLAVRFQAANSNECWQFDLSPSDLKHVKEPLWFDPALKRPLLMIYSIVDDRSGVCYQEYRNVYGEDTEAALRFLFNAMVGRDDSEFPFRGIPNMIYMDCGPISKSKVFQQTMQCLGVDVRTHMPSSKEKHRTSARSKGKVERAFRTTKEAHEVLYHLREPKNEDDANERLFDYLKYYNDRSHRSENHSRMDDWQNNLPSAGIRSMCSWERYCTFAREPEKRKVGIDARIAVDGTEYEVNPDLAGERVILWWGLFDTELYVEHEDQRYGPYHPVSGPIPLHRYRKFKKTRNEKQLDKLEALAKVLSLPDSGSDKHRDLSVLKNKIIKSLSLPEQPFIDPDPFHEFCYQNIILAKLAIADYLGKPLAFLTQEQTDWLDALLEETLVKHDVMLKVREYFISSQGDSNVT